MVFQMPRYRVSEIAQGGAKAIRAAREAEAGMIFMADTSDDLGKLETEMGCQVEELFTPLTRRNPKRPDAPFACDNGGFSRFDSDEFEKMLAKHRDRRHLCRFVAVPDVVGNARRTLEAFEWWRDKISGWPLAFVAQDGIENLTIPWQSIDAIFIGGSTGWKLSKHAADVIRTAIICDKWVHVGRVNTPGRWEYFEGLGAHSCDGTGLARYSWMRQAIYQAANQPGLFSGEMTA
jgi:hypothetical protein